MKKLLPLVTLTAFLFFAILSSTARQNQGKVDYSKAKIEYKIISAIAGTCGYDIYVNGILAIHQSGIPGSTNQVGFNTQAEGEKAAALTIKNMREGKPSPIPTMQELRELQIITPETK